MLSAYTGPSMNDWITLAELAEASATPARTIRFYISRGLLDGPSKAGRGAAYSTAHVARLEEIKTLQGEGRTLAEIAHRLSRGGDTLSPAATPEAWWRHVVCDDVIVMTRADASPWRTKQIRSAIEDLAARLKEQNS
jgi:DNA-binding transcriptional MerR regulator